MARTGRQLKLIEIINKNEIETQEALAEALRNEGYLVTQATVSRDIKDLVEKGILIPQQGRVRDVFYGIRCSESILVIPLPEDL